MTLANPCSPVTILHHAGPQCSGVGPLVYRERLLLRGGVTLPSHNISVNSGSHGDVEIWPEEAKQGTTVTTSAVPTKATR